MKIGIVPSDNDGKIFLNTAYRTYVESKGDIPYIMLRPEDVDMVDGILLIGGIDVNPTLFGYNNVASRNSNVHQDKFQISIVERAVSLGLPVEGICRGLQLLYYMFLENKPDYVYYQHIDKHDQGDYNFARDEASHAVTRVSDKAKFWVNSMHHQAVLVPATRIPPEVTFTTRHGGERDYLVVEGIEFEVGKSKISAVQWHPEELNGLYPNK
jgi:putative glutamine amidotransferase